MYNEIYPAEGWADKISKYLKKVADEKPNMYAKTKRRYENLAYSLLESASLIASILEEDLLVPSSNDEFNELASSDQSMLHDKLADLNRRFKKTEEFSSSIHTSEERDSYHTDIPEYGFIDTCKYYDSVFRDASTFNFGYSEVNDCARLLYTWFHTRFMPDVRDPEFRCQIRYLPTWIASFIIVYGKYYEQKKTAYFQKILDKWCDKVRMGEGGIYTIPYEIYRIEKEFKDGICQPEDYTIEAVVINDLLVNGILYRLSDAEFEGSVRYNPGDLANTVRDRNPALYNKVRLRIAKRKDLIREIGLTPVGGSDIDE